MHKSTKIILAVVVFILLTGVAQASDWPMFQHDARHTGYTTEKVPDELDLLWSYETGDWVYSSPAVVDGKVFVGSSDNKIYCLNENTGKLIWSYETEGYAYSPVVANGKVFIGSNDDKIYCINEDTGKLIWSYETGGHLPAVADGRVFVGGSDDNKIYCFGETTPTSKPTLTPTLKPTPSPVPTLIDSDDDGVPDKYDYNPYNPDIQSRRDIKTPGFEAVFAIAGLLAVSYLLRKRKDHEPNR